MDDWALAAQSPVPLLPGHVLRDTDPRNTYESCSSGDLLIQLAYSVHLLGPRGLMNVGVIVFLVVLLTNVFDISSLSNRHSLQQFIPLKCWFFFFSSIGGLILDKTVSNPNLAGIVVYTPVINGESPSTLPNPDLNRIDLNPGAPTENKDNPAVRTRFVNETRPLTWGIQKSKHTTEVCTEVAHFCSLQGLLASSNTEKHTMAIRWALLLILLGTLDVSLPGIIAVCGRVTDSSLGKNSSVKRLDMVPDWSHNTKSNQELCQCWNYRETLRAVCII